MENDTASQLAASGSPNDEPARIYSLVSEVWMLVDYIAGDPSKGLNRVEVANPKTPGLNFKPGELLKEVSDIERRLAMGQLEQYDRASMQVVRDALNLLIWPASGLTVAYTTIVTGPLRARAASRYSLAQQAYAKLDAQAQRHTRRQRWIVLLATIFMLVAIWESAKVALGKALMQNLDMVHSQQALLSADKVKLELSLATAEAAKGRPEVEIGTLKMPLDRYRVCDRALLSREELNQKLGKPADPDVASSSLLPFTTPEERDVCGRDDILKVNLQIARDDLRSYMQNWPGMVGSGFGLVRDILVGFKGASARLLENAPAQFENKAASAQHAAAQTQPTSSLEAESQPGSNKKIKPEPDRNDIELRIAPLLLVWGNLGLPIIFSFLGSAIFVMLDHYNKIRDNLLHPRDALLAPVRLVLGSVVGACVGLFFSAYGPMPQPGASTVSALVSSLTLTASGVAFLAGFGVETVFSMLEGLTSRLFTLPSQQK